MKVPLMVWHNLLWLGGSFFVSLLVIPLIIRLACAAGIVDRPDGKLKHHAQPTPYLGGLALFLIILLPCILCVPKLFLGLTVLFAVGLMDDIFRLPSWTLFIGHSIGALCFLWAGCIAPVFAQPSVNYGISFFWMVSIINAFNLIDVMDGLTATVSICACVAFFLFAVLTQQFFMLPILSVLLGSLGGFLVYNKPPARIFLGDAGSLLLGGFFSALCLNLPWACQGLAYFFIPLLLLIIPVFEITTLIFIRTAKGIPFYCGSPDHFSIYLQRKAWSKWSILILIAGVSMFGLLVSVTYFFDILSMKRFFIIPVTAIVFWWFSLIK